MWCGVVWMDGRRMEGQKVECSDNQASQEIFDDNKTKHACLRRTYLALRPLHHIPSFRPTCTYIRCRWTDGRQTGRMSDAMRCGDDDDDGDDKNASHHHAEAGWGEAVTPTPPLAFRHMSRWTAQAQREVCTAATVLFSMYVRCDIRRRRLPYRGGPACTGCIRAMQC
ncbi:hypothetical protein BKA81DRAFT_365115 [Phyllosticta paracitricarpa]